MLQTSTSHPRLVTAKLTATPQPSTTTGPGWSRPSSTVSSTAPTPLPGSAKGSPAPLATSGGAPLPPPAGKVIQPQPRSTQDVATQRRETAMKPVWGNTKGGASNPTKLDAVENDFPTAAEVAQGPWASHLSGCSIMIDGYMQGVSHERRRSLPLQTLQPSTSRRSRLNSRLKKTPSVAFIWIQMPIIGTRFVFGPLYPRKWAFV